MTYSLRRKAGRHAMAAALIETISGVPDLEVTRENESTPYWEREVRLKFAHSGVVAHIALMGDCGPGVGVFVNWTSRRRLCPTFGTPMGASVNPHHGCKATGPFVGDRYAVTASDLEHLGLLVLEAFHVVAAGEAFAELEAA